MRTEAEIRRLLKLAEKLGFQDDVDHWKAELAKLEPANAESAECICTDSCPEDAAENPCPPCRTMDPYEPCPVIGFGCGNVSGEPCDCCTPAQRTAAA